MSIDTATSDGRTNCSHMSGVCAGARHTCGFTNDSVGERFCNGNRCSFPLMVRCGAMLLYLEMFYTERALLLKDTSSLRCPRDLFGACHLLLQIETSEKTQASDAGEIWPSLLFSAEKEKKKEVSSSLNLLWHLSHWAWLQSAVCKLRCLFLVSFNVPQKPSGEAHGEPQWG